MLLLFFQLFGKPIESTLDPVPGLDTDSIDAPSVVLDFVQAELLDNVLGFETRGQVLFVGENEENRVLDFRVEKQLLQLLLGRFEGVGIGTVNDEDHSFGALVVDVPYLSKTVLAPQIPGLHVDVFVLDFLVVGADGRVALDDSAQLAC